jgi:acyl-CoA synthetase (NDP forming)
MSGETMSTAERLIARARRRNETTLLEPEGFALLEAAGIRCPRRLFAHNAAEAECAETAALGTDRVVVKVVARHILHKSDVGGVAVVPNQRAAISAAVRNMERAFVDQAIEGYSISEFIAYDASPGGEWLLGLRWTDEFGPVVTFGPGGIATEFLASSLKPGRDVAIVAPGIASREQTEEAVGRLAWTQLATGGVRKQTPRTSLAELATAIAKFSSLAQACGPDRITDLEINPLVCASGDLVALDVLVKLGTHAVADVPSRPIHKIRHLLTPKSIAVAGVSTQMNPGHVILTNILREGFDPGSVYVIKPGVDQMEGCRAVPSIRLLPQAVDLLILSVSAAQIPDALIDLVESRKAESVIVIPGGLEEKEGTAELVSQMHETLRASRATDWRGPVVNGGNCVGIQSRPGRYDTMFIPAEKLGTTTGPASPVAFIAQSGAFAVSRATRLVGIRPKYSITVGNQMDLTIGDYLRYLETDPDIRVFGIYVEGFRPMDGRATLEAVKRITASGRTVIMYRGGRTPEGARATASHTASISGDYLVTRELATAAGAIVAENLEDFTDLVAMFTLLGGRQVMGRRIGAVTNAGYECVAIADNIGDLQLPAFGPATEGALLSMCERFRLTALVDVHNPLDVTPMLGDEGYELAMRLVLEDDRVDVGLIGCVPATGALNTLSASPAHGEDVLRAGSFAMRLVALREQTTKPWIAVIDAGSIYDPLVRCLQAAGIPTFRSADRALRLLNIFVGARFRDTLRAQAERWIDEFSRPAEGAPTLIPNL